MAGLFKSVAELFSATPLSNPAAPPAQAGGNPAPAPDGSNPAPQPGVQSNAAPLKSPMDDLSEVFKIAEKNAAENKNPLETPLFQMDSAKFNERVTAMDFLSAAPAELVQKAQGGDTAALMTLINSVGQQAYAQATELNTKLIEAGVNNRIAGLQQVLPQQIRQQQVRESLAAGEQSKALLHPAVAPMVDMVQKQYEAAYPAATGAEIAALVQKHFTTAAQALAPAAAPSTAQQATSASQDFSGFFASN